LMSTKVDLSSICVFRIWISYPFLFRKMRYKSHSSFAICFK
jgi:hypothetical protein